MAFVPTDISGCRLWLDAGTLSLNNNDPVDLWEDGSAQGNDCTASGATRPTFKTNQLNGLPGVYFSVGPYLESSTGVGISGTGGRTLFFVANNTNGWVLASLGKSSNAWSPTASNLFMWGYDPSYNVQWTGSQNKVFTQMYSNGILNNWENNVIKNENQNIGTSFNTQNNGYYIGDWFPHSRPLSGYLYEVIVYDTALSSTNRKSVEAYLLYKYLNIELDASVNSSDVSTITDIPTADEYSFIYEISTPDTSTLSDIITPEMLSSVIANGTLVTHIAGFPVKVQKVGYLPTAAGTPIGLVATEGKVYINTIDNKFYWFSGGSWRHT
jgi:hypothetical protein